MLIRSITELCVEDHHNDPSALTAWLWNKTVPNVLSWIASDELYCAVAVDEQGICGFGSISRLGEILLCYVAESERTDHQTEVPMRKAIAR